jgi:hypothetical protein
LTSSDIPRETLRPSYLAESDDVPHAVSGEPLWSENYLTAAYSPATKIGVYIHMGTASFDPTLWNDILVLYLPGDRFLTFKGFGRTNRSDGPAGAGVTYRCDEPFAKWTKTFNGAARLISGDGIRSATVPDGQHVAAELALTFEATSPAFDIGNLDGQSWGSSHYHQHCRVSGRVAYDGEGVEFDGIGLRDHSWGPRDITRFAGSEWVTGQFPSGWNFSAFVGRNLDGGNVAFANRGDAGQVRAATITDPAPQLTAIDQMGEGFTFGLEGEGGPVEIETEFLQVAPLGMAGYSELVIGTDERLEQGVVLMIADALVRYRCGDEIGHGYCQRTYRVAA